MMCGLVNTPDALSTPPPAPFKILAIALLLLALFSLLGILPIQPPMLKSPQSGSNAFSLSRALSDVRQVAQQPHPVGSGPHGLALGYITRELQAMDMSVDILPAINRTHQLTNVLARPKIPPGSDIILLVAHYDSVRRAPGAADDGVGVATLLETARVLGKQTGAKNEVGFLFTDGEELGLLGAEAFIRDQPDFLKHVRAVLNFEARGNRGPAIMFQTGPRNLELIRLLRDCPHPVATSFAQEVYHRMPNDTDFTRFLGAGLSGFNFAVIMGVEDYHQPADNIENLDERSVTHYLAYATTLADRLSKMDLSVLESAEDAIYFPLPPGFLVVYPESMSVPLAASTAVLFLIVTIIGFARRQLRWPRVLLSFLIANIVPVLMYFVGVLVMKYLPLKADATGHNPILDHLGIFTFAAITASVILMLAAKQWLAVRIGSPEILTGTLGAWVALSLIATLSLRGFSYLFVWPALGGVVALWLTTRLKPGPVLSNITAAIFSTAPACILFAPTMMLSHYALGLNLLPLLIALAAFVAWLGFHSMPTQPWQPGRKQDDALPTE